MKVMLTESLRAEVTGPSIVGTTRFFLCDLTVSVGCYSDPAQREHEFSHSFGSMQWLWSDSDDLRFDVTDRRLLSLFMDVPSVDYSDPSIAQSWANAPVITGGLVADQVENFSLPSARKRWIDPTGRRITCLLGNEVPKNAERVVLRVSEHLDLLFMDGHPAGWSLNDPAACIVNGWEEPSKGRANNSAALLLRDYLRCTSDSAIEALREGDPAAHAILRDMSQRARSYPGDDSEIEVLRTAIDHLIEDAEQ